jgi:hypothetical protein
MKRIRELIEKKSGIARTASAAYLCARAEKIIQRMVNSKQVEVRKYQNQVLFLVVQNPSLSQEIFNHQEQIKKQLTKKLKKPINRISYRVGS